MSEYQYYEFQALDRPLDENELRQLRSLSTRASITPTSFVNVYHFGDFKGNPRALMERFFDAFVYVANRGTRWLMFRLPRNAVVMKSLATYCAGDGASIKTKGKHIILEFLSETECGDREEGEGWLATLIPLRNDILHGDLRPLYLAWLACVQDGHVAGESVEPPVPAGLKNLSASLRALAESLRIDEDLIAAAAQQSDDDGTGPASSEDRLRMIRSLGQRKKDDFLLQIVAGKGQEVRSALLEALRQWQPPKSDRSPRRGSVREMLLVAGNIGSERRRQAAARVAKQQCRRVRVPEQSDHPFRSIPTNSSANGWTSTRSCPSPFRKTSLHEG